MTPDQSHYALQALVASGALRASQIEKALQSREQEIRRLKERLASLESLSGGSSPTGGGRRGRRAVRARSAAAPRRRRLSAKTRALRKLQGKYMGLVRGLKAAEKARVRAVREKQGMTAAISLASVLGKKTSGKKSG